MIDIILLYAMIAGIMCTLLFTFALFFEKNVKMKRKFLIFGVFFMAAFVAITEYAFWLEGINFFQFLPNSFPLIFYFAIWIAFIIWSFEQIGQRKFWIAILILAAILILVANFCMNCIKF